MNIDIKSKYYITKSFGGWSPCIQGNTRYGLRPFEGSVLPNCVGYSVARFNSLCQEDSCRWLGNRNASELYALGISQGLKGGSEPVVGGLIVWSNSSAGHCAIIEQIINKDTVLTSESGWNYAAKPIIREIIRKRVNGAWECPGYKFVGIVYPPEDEHMKTFYAYTKGEAIKDPEVLRLQILLNGLQGSKLTKDSYYGPACTNAVKKWQAAHGIKATGTCDQQTWNSILGKG